jgi:F-type H+-transporting ATPase subunit gamma
MAQLQALRRRIRSISNTRQTTKAMQLVDATKLRRSQAVAKRSHDYIAAALETLQQLLAHDVEPSELARWRRDHIKTVALVVIASDRGLAGAYNLNVIARLRSEAARYQAEGVAVKVVAIGTHAIRAAEKLPHVEVIQRVVGRATDPDIADIQPLSDQLRTAYAEGAIDAIQVIYTHSISALQQEVRVLPVWPVELEAGSAAGDGGVGGPARPQTQPGTSGVTMPAEPARANNHVLTLLEPSAEEVVAAALTRLFDAALLGAAQEAGVSEHAMRMVAMRAATDNASDLIDSLTLKVNTIRQAGITQEISEITGAAAAIEEQ